MSHSSADGVGQVRWMMWIREKARCFLKTWCLRARLRWFKGLYREKLRSDDRKAKMHVVEVTVTVPLSPSCWCCLFVSHHPLLMLMLDGLSFDHQTFKLRSPKPIHPVELTDLGACKELTIALDDRVIGSRIPYEPSSVQSSPKQGRQVQHNTTHS